MGRFYKVALDTLYLTDTGLATGRPCRLRITGLLEKRVNYSGVAAVALDGTPHLVVNNTGGKGQAIQIQIDFLPKARLDDIVTLINSKLAASAPISMQITGDVYNATFNVMPAIPNAITGGVEFSQSIVKSVTLNFIISG